MNKEQIAENTTPQIAATKGEDIIGTDKRLRTHEQRTKGRSSVTVADERRGDGQRAEDLFVSWGSGAREHGRRFTMITIDDHQLILLPHGFNPLLCFLTGSTVTRNDGWQSSFFFF
ncbi:uncharacterized protein LOC127801772 [Diospyros lotus]|uniref:uncharacterized protein LOC127801772 n=1 Tax=Diospyros lotus TaxID=55363 RepID=UPI00225B3EE3|nr:uncharacterized protein LOC127801772 [Diospyros lotus]